MSKYTADLHTSSVTDTWPPVYTVKQHPRTRRVKLKVSVKNGLQLIVPVNFNLKSVPKILAKHQEWIVLQLNKLKALSLENTTALLPSNISLKAINQVWKVQYIQGSAPLQLVARPHQELVILGNVQNKMRCKNLLIVWLKQLATLHLAILLREVSLKTNLSYTRITIRAQQTRWGSCTKKKAISLNYKLLFLPPHLVQHILIHELCHTVHLDHSEKFWQLVKKFDSYCHENRQAIKKANVLLPKWINN